MLLVMIWARPGIAQSPMSLSDCINFALEQHPQVKIDRMKMLDADYQIRENKAVGLPQITAGLNYQYFFQKPISVLPDFFGGGQAFDRTQSFALRNNINGSIGWNNLLFSNSYRIGLKAAKYYRELVSQQLNVTRRNLRNQVTEAYLPTLLIDENLGMFDKNIANLEKILNETKAINKAGFAEQLDVDRLQLSLSNLKTERENLQRQYEITVSALKFAMGKPIADEMTIADNLDKLLLQYEEADITSAVNFENRPEYIQLLKARQLSELQINLNQKTWLPTVAAFANYQPGFQGENLFKEQFYTPSGVLGLAVNFNLWDGGAAKAREQRKMLEVAQVNEQKRLLEEGIRLEVEVARKQYVNANLRVLNQMKNLELAQKIYETTQTKYKAGVGSSLEVITAEQALYQNQQSLMQARYDLLQAKIAVKKALGNE